MVPRPKSPRQFIKLAKPVRADFDAFPLRLGIPCVPAIKLAPIFRSFCILMHMSVASGLAQEKGPASKPPLFPVKAGGNWGFIDASGALKIPARYSEVGAVEVFDGEFVAANWTTNGD